MFSAYALALCADPAALPDVKSLPPRKPIIKPLYQYVVRPGSHIIKEIIAFDLNGEPLELSVENLPRGRPSIATSGRSNGRRQPQTRACTSSV